MALKFLYKSLQLKYIAWEKKQIHLKIIQGRPFYAVTLPSQIATNKIK